MKFLIWAVPVLIIIVLVSCKANNYKSTSPAFILKEGDILFQDMDCGPLCDAIEAVTEGYKGAKLSHLGLVIMKNDSAFVLEAVGAGVVETPLDKFLGRSSDSEGKPKVLVARIKKKYQHLIPFVVKAKEQYLNLPYNNEYILNDTSYYCSQLIHVLFKNANNGQDFFQLNPMTFKEPHSNSYFEAWIDYFNNLKCEIPEGLPGINPGGMSRSDKINIIHYYGLPEGIDKS